MATASSAAAPAALPRLITIGEVAESLSVSRSTIYNLIDRGALRAIKIGGAVRFKHDDVLAYIERSTTASAQS